VTSRTETERTLREHVLALTVEEQRIVLAYLASAATRVLESAVEFAASITTGSAGRHATRPGSTPESVAASGLTGADPGQPDDDGDDTDMLILGLLTAKDTLDARKKAARRHLSAVGALEDTAVFAGPGILGPFRDRPHYAANGSGPHREHGLTEAERAEFTRDHPGVDVDAVDAIIDASYGAPVRPGWLYGPDGALKDHDHGPVPGEDDGTPARRLEIWQQHLDGLITEREAAELIDRLSMPGVNLP
jgi:hypothetical protein